MAALQCEICGGKLIGKPGGIFECEFCGVEYSTEWARIKIQEIKGTVKVEGTVDVKGTVAVDTTANLEALLKRGYFALEDKKWDEAGKHFDDALNMDAECAEAYLGLLLVSQKLPGKECLASAELDIEKDSNFKKAMWFADSSLKAMLEKQLEAFRPAYAVRMARLAALRERAETGSKLIAIGSHGRKYGLRTDGKVLFHSGDNYFDKFKQELSSWENIVAISSGEDLFIALRADGTVNDPREWKEIVEVGVCSGRGKDIAVGLKSNGTVVSTGSWDLSKWTDIISIFCDYEIVGLKSDGTLITTGAWDLREWTDIVSVRTTRNYAVGLKADGTVVLAGNRIAIAWNKKEYDLSEVETWRDIIAISALEDSIQGLKADGRLITAGWKKDNTKTENLIAFHRLDKYWFYLYADGTVEHTYGKGDWKLFENIDNLEQERREARERQEQERIAQEKLKEANRLAELKRQKEERIAREKREEEERIALQKRQEEERIVAQRRDAGLCQYCGGELKGFFTKKCVSCGKEKNY